MKKELIITTRKEALEHLKKVFNAATFKQLEEALKNG